MRKQIDRKMRVNVDKSKAMRYSKYGNGGRMHVILNGEPIEEVDCFKYLGSQVAHIINVIHIINVGCTA